MTTLILPPQDTLLQLLRYEKSTGKLYFKHRDQCLFEPSAKRTSVQRCRMWNSRFAGKESFTRTDNGYGKTKVCGEEYRTHRVIWKMVHGTDPDQIDHINGIRDDNRIENLRSVTVNENNRNLSMPSTNTSGFVGVGYDKSRSKWTAEIYVRGVKKYLGRFKTKEAAIEARKEANMEYGYHINHGKAL